MTGATITTLIRKSWVTIVVAIMVIIGLLGWWMAIDAGSSSALQNHAVTHKTETDQVRTEVSKALTQVLSYDYQHPKATEQAAEAHLKGKARKEYDTLFATLKKKAPDQKLVLSAQVEAAGVKKLDDNSAKLLVFLDQSSKRAKDKEASISAAQLSITAEKSGGSWKITELKPL